MPTNMDRNDGTGGGPGTDAAQETGGEQVEPVTKADEQVGLPAHTTAKRERGRGSVIALTLLGVAAAGAFALIGWDVARSSDEGGRGGAGAVRSPAANGGSGLPSADPSPSASARASASAIKPSGRASARPGGAANGSGGSQGDSAADRAARQRESVRRSLTSPHPRPPLENDISQDELDREREKGETEPPVTVVEPTP